MFYIQQFKKIKIFIRPYSCCRVFQRQIFLVKENNHPIILKLFLQKEIRIETVCILIDITETMKYLDKHLKNDIIWDDIGSTIKKYTPFIVYDKDKFKKILLDYFDGL